MSKENIGVKEILFCEPDNTRFVDLLDDSYVPSALHIARGLSGINRYSGRCDPSWTVAEHSIVVAKLASYHLAAGEASVDMMHKCFAYGIVHDAAEIFTGDVPSPIKRLAPAISAFEDYMVAKVHRKLFGIDIEQEVVDIVHKADKLVGWVEMKQFVQSTDARYAPDGIYDLESTINGLIEQQRRKCITREEIMVEWMRVAEEAKMFL